MTVYVLLGVVQFDARDVEQIKMLAAFDHYPTSQEVGPIALAHSIRTGDEFHSYRVEEMPLLKGVA